MKNKIFNYLRLGRSHTYPADWLLMIVPFMCGGYDLVRVFIISAVMFGVHWFSFGENSLLDFTQGYDKDDLAKSHHPLNRGDISINHASNAIHWTKALMGTFMVALTVLWAPNPVWGLAAIMIWFIWGTAYNVGLSKESPLGFLPIVICFAAMGAWGWFLSHAVLDTLGWAYLVCAGSIILFQIGWSGHLKDIKQDEPSNLLVKLGAKVETWTRSSFEQELEEDDFTIGGNQTLQQEKYEMFIPGKSLYLGVIMKFIGILALLYLAFVSVGFNVDLTNLLSVSRMTWAVMMVIGMLISMMLILPQREWIKSRELKNMSIMEIFSIFAPVPLLLPWFESIIILLFAISYFYFANKKLWGTSYPKV